MWKDFFPLLLCEGEKSTGNVDNFFMREQDFSSKYSLGKADDHGGVEEVRCYFG